MTLLARLRLAAIGGSWILALGTPALATPLVVGSLPGTGGPNDWPATRSTEMIRRYGIEDGQLGSSPISIRSIGRRGRALAPELSITLSTILERPPWHRLPGRQR